MHIIVGSVLKRTAGYEFDTWTEDGGVSSSYPYRRIEEAYHARRAAIESSGRAGWNVRTAVAPALYDFRSGCWNDYWPAAGLVDACLS